MSCSGGRAFEVLKIAAAILRRRRARQCSSFGARLAFHYGLARFRPGMGVIAAFRQAWRIAR